MKKIFDFSAILGAYIAGFSLMIFIILAMFYEIAGMMDTKILVGLILTVFVTNFFVERIGIGTTDEIVIVIGSFVFTMMTLDINIIAIKTLISVYWVGLLVSILSLHAYNWIIVKTCKKIKNSL